MDYLYSYVIIKFTKACFSPDIIEFKLRVKEEEKKYYGEITMEKQGFNRIKLIKNIEHKIIIEIFDKILNLKLKELCAETKYITFDGSNLEMNLSFNQIQISINISNHNKQIIERNLIEINNIFNYLLELFKFNLNEFEYYE